MRMDLKKNHFVNWIKLFGAHVDVEKIFVLFVDYIGGTSVDMTICGYKFTVRKVSGSDNTLLYGAV